MNLPEAPAMVGTRLVPELGSVVAARHMVVEAAQSWSLPERVQEDAALVVSELASNAVLHARSVFTVSARRLGQGLRVEVADRDPALPGPAAERFEDLMAVRSMTGRGLALVAATSDRWGCDRAPGGKVVWAEVGTSRLRVRPSSPPAFPPAPPAPRLSPAAASAGVKDVTAATGAGRQVHLVGVPVRLLIESSRQLTDLQREMQVIGLDRTGPRELLSLANATREVEASIGHLREAGLSDAKRAIARGDVVVDYDLVVPEDASFQLGRLGTILMRACSRLARRYLLTLPASDEVVAFRMWWREEVLSQLAGRPPAPCPITAAGAPAAGAPAAGRPGVSRQGPGRARALEGNAR
jgi:anti-sigma regulatory factor (Ser/Thr protein kinase)